MLGHYSNLPVTALRKLVLAIVVCLMNQYFRSENITKAQEDICLSITLL